MHKKVIAVCSVLVIGLTLFALNNRFNRLKSTKNPVEKQVEVLKNGDIIFTIQTAGQGEAVRIATHSEYTHTGIIFKLDGKWMVYEAVEPVSCTSLESFVAQSDSGVFTIRRLKNRDSLLDSGKEAIMKSFLERQMKKSYDLYFSWNDDKMYCSELVWKAYRKTGIILCETKSLGSFNLKHPVVKEILKERYGKKIPLDEKVVAPSDILASVKLETVK